MTVWRGTAVSRACTPARSPVIGAPTISRGVATILVDAVSDAGTLVATIESVGVTDAGACAPRGAAATSRENTTAGAEKRMETPRSGTDASAKETRQQYERREPVAGSGS